jgi:excisionase family DNA binding protein
MRKVRSAPRSAKRAVKVLAFLGLKNLLSGTDKRISIRVGNDEFRLPEDEQHLLIQAVLDAVDSMGAQKVGAVLSTQEVADLLNVSRPFVIKLIETRQLKAFKVGSHRRVLKAETLAFRQKMRNQKNEALDALVAGTERLELDFK